jgi:nicotinate-nucleotide--dimethylbenzimidazole phosphoribosyltransferase
MPSEQSPFVDLAELLTQLPEGDRNKADKVNSEISKKPNTQSVGLQNILQWLALWQEAELPTVGQTHICVLASSYKGLSDISVVSDYIERASKGRAPVNHMCIKNGIGLRVLELAPDMPHDVSVDWSERDCMGAIAFGMEATASGGDLLGLSDLAPGNEKQAKRIIKSCRDLLEDETQAGDIKPFLQVLREHGGREIAAVVGALIAARSRRLPVLIEGWGALAAFILLRSMNEEYVAHARVAAISTVEQYDVVTSFGVTPIIAECVGVGPGCGIALATSFIAGAVTLVTVPDA